MFSRLCSLQHIGNQHMKCTPEVFFFSGTPRSLSAFHRPVWDKSDMSGSQTPYTDALKAAAVYPSPYRTFWTNPGFETRVPQCHLPVTSGVAHHSPLATMLPNDPFWFRLVPHYNTLYLQSNPRAFCHPGTSRPDMCVTSQFRVDSEDKASST